MTLFQQGDRISVYQFCGKYWRWSFRRVSVSCACAIACQIFTSSEREAGKPMG
ncbi:MAG: hypothetical protein SAK29_35160 [Scytonema sp. PMC 1069.18]|nr:hypothetical protein [Scytonema sp. PMC 1069.18]MEC4882601.1 hypothetical protein [Scytonema sp. PMC 1070.18]